MFGKAYAANIGGHDELFPGERGGCAVGVDDAVVKRDGLGGVQFGGGYEAEAIEDRVAGHFDGLAVEVGGCARGGGGGIRDAGGACGLYPDPGGVGGENGGGHLDHL